MTTSPLPNHQKIKATSLHELNYCSSGFTRCQQTLTHLVLLGSDAGLQIPLGGHNLVSLSTPSSYREEPQPPSATTLCHHLFCRWWQTLMIMNWILEYDELCLKLHWLQRELCVTGSDTDVNIRTDETNVICLLIHRLHTASMKCPPCLASGFSSCRNSGMRWQKKGK